VGKASKEVVQALGPKLEEVLASNLISPVAFKVAMNDDFDAFLGERAKTITATVSNLTAW
jgi:hypothetical protein